MKRSCLLSLATGTLLGWTTSVAQSAEPALLPTPSESSKPTPYAASSAMPIDLPTALRLADASNPMIAFAQARVRQAYAQLEQANVLYLPNITSGFTYLRHDGQIQRAPGEIITTSRSSIAVFGGPSARFDLADALFLPLVVQRLTAAEIANARAVTNNVQLDAALAYLDLLQVHAQLAVNADTLARAEQMYERAKVADEAGLSKTKGDVNRAYTEVSVRRVEKQELIGRSGVASARLARILLLQPNVDLRPADPTVVPVVLVPPECVMDDLIMTAYQNRPELESSRAQILAAEARVRQARYSPLLPKLQFEYLAGGYGGGRNDDIGNFDGRGDFVGSAVWELRNLGLGNRAQVREREAQVDQTNFRLADVQAQVGAEVSEAAKIAAARFSSLDDAQTAVKQATELYRKLVETSFGMIGPRPQYDALEPLLAIQALYQARTQYLNAVIEFNKAQFRLYTAIGQPAIDSLEKAAPQATEVPANPPSPDLPRPIKDK